MKNIDEILEGLKGFQPEVDNPNELTERIMNALPDQNTYEKPAKPKRKGLLIALHIVSSAAAVWLIGMFFYFHSFDNKIEKQIHTTNYTSDFSYGKTLRKVYTVGHRKIHNNYYLTLKNWNYEKH